MGIEQVENVNFDDPLFYKHFGNKNSENFDYIERIILNLSLCHTVISEMKEG